MGQESAADVTAGRALDLERIRRFLVVARQGNFSRAAEELHIAQPVLSRQIRALETELGADLFVRDSRGAALTAAGHRLAGKHAASITDLADDHLLQDPDVVPEWRDVASEMRGRRRTAPPRVIHTVEEKLEHVAAGRGIVILPESTATYYQRPDVSYVQLTDIAPTEVALAYVSARRSPLIAEFAALARDRG